MNDINLLFDPAFLTKIVIIILLLLFTIFLFIVATQINRMNQVVRQTTSSTIIIGTGILLFLLTIVLFILALVIL